MIDETDSKAACLQHCTGSHGSQHDGELRDARDLIVQLQRELDRAREVIAQQRTIVSAVVRARGHQ